MKVSEVPENKQNPSLTHVEFVDEGTVSQKVNYIDSIPSVEVYATGGSAVDVNNVKRKRGLTPPPLIPNPGERMVQAHTDVPVAGPSSGVDPHIPTILTNNEVTMTDVPVPSRPKKKRVAVRKPPRRLPITLRRQDIWQKLDKVDAGLSMTEWLYLDKQASKDMMDGIRTMRSKRKKITTGRDNRQLITAEPIPRTPKRVPVVAAVGVGDSDSSSWEEDDSSVSSELTFGTTTTNTSNPDSIENSENAIRDDEGSLVDYPYNLQSMRNSAPLKGPVSVNGMVFECTFDSGAAVSVMNSGLATKLGLQANGDRMHLTSFDSKTREPCHIVQSVPIRVGGHLRAEHMCIQGDSGGIMDDYCILGMTWFRAYAVSVSAQENAIFFPQLVRTDSKGNVIPDFTDGTVFVQCYSTHDGEGGGSLPSILVEPSRSAQSSEVFAVSVALVNKDAGSNEETHIKTKGNGWTTLDNVRGEVMDDSDTNQDDGTLVDFNQVPVSLRPLIKQQKECFVEVSGLGRVDCCRHEIPIAVDATPLKSRPFRLTWEEQDSMAKELQGLLDLDLIKPSKGVWSSPCFFIKKKDGSLRLVIDYRRLNQITIKDNYPLPIIDTVLDSLAGASVFSTLDAASGYHQVPMDPDSMDKTGFVTPQGTYEFKVMPFGLTSAPATYQRMMANLMGEYVGQFTMVFIDDVIVYSRNMEEHQEHLRLVLEKCQKAGLRLKFKKCSFGANVVNYLGHTISANGVLPHEHNLHKIQNFPTPRSADEVRSFLGTTGYYRRFISKYAVIAQPLSSLLKKESTFQWTSDQEMAYSSLKNSLTSAPILAYPDRHMVQILTTDASNKGISAILSQSPDGGPEEERVISYNSRTLRPAEVNYATVHLEALAIVWAVEKYRHYLMGRHFKLRTDNAALVFVMNPTKPSPKMARWAACLMEYDFEIVHLIGTNNPADSLSRLFPRGDGDDS